MKSPRFAIARFACELGSAKQGLAFLEFAMGLPIFMGIGMYGSEVAYMALQRTNLEQVTVAVADNAARMGTTINNDIAATIFERDIAQLMVGANVQAGNLDVFNSGRVIVSSLEQDDSGNQEIAWQRCRGKLSVVSRYGTEGTNGTSNSGFTGMGEGNGIVTAPSRDAVMFVEISYRHTPLFGTLFLKDDIILSEEAAFNVRDNRDLSSGLRPDTTPKNDCSKYSAT